jgi:hypothetical protein
MFSYIVARDYGFAPNPFFGFCTLATCKPQIRAKAAVDDWIIGTGAKGKYNLAGYLIFAMKVDEILDFNGYWNDPRFGCKRPLLNGSLKQIYGDNIYHRRGNQWFQADSHHSLADGKPNQNNIERDTSADRVLISQTFVYYGAAARSIPKRIRHYRRIGADLCCSTQGHRIVDSECADVFLKWLETLNRWGMQGLPLEFLRHQKATT